MPKKVSARKATFSQAEISSESEGEGGTEPKKGFFQSSRKLDKKVTEGRSQDPVSRIKPNKNDQICLQNAIVSTENRGRELRFGKKI